VIFVTHEVLLVATLNDFIASEATTCRMGNGVDKRIRGHSLNGGSAGNIGPDTPFGLTPLGCWRQTFVELARPSRYES
jgi:hypothetical protein